MEEGVEDRPVTPLILSMRGGINKRSVSRHCKIAKRPNFASQSIIAIDCSRCYKIAYRARKRPIRNVSGGRE